MRKFMVVMDDSSEFLNALLFAALRAQNTGGQVVICAVIAPEEFQHWLGVGDAMREEAQERIEAHYEVFKKWMVGRVDLKPELIVRHGQKDVEILAAIEEDPSIAVLVLGASSDRKGPGTLIQDLVAKRGGEMPIPVTIVPGNLKHDSIALIA